MEAPANEKKTQTSTFEQLLRREMEGLGLSDVDLTVVSERRDGDEGPLPEPYAAFVSEELAGICLSGGGIRSATFNLGFLEGLARLGLLDKFHYLSTVSGGGYIGGWWSAWRSRKKQEDAFPGLRLEPKGVEASEIRHLREFGNFLSPRVGFLEIETWQFVSSVIVAAVPTLLAAAAVIVGVVLLYLFIAAVFLVSRNVDSGNLLLATAAREVSTVFVTLFTLLVLVGFEDSTARSERVGEKWRRSKRYLGFTAVACAAVALASFVFRRDLASVPSPLLVPNGPEIFCKAIGCDSLGALPADSRFLWVPFFSWTVAAAVVGFVRLLVQCWGIESTAPVGRPLLDRVLARLVALNVIWATGLVLLNLSLLISRPGMAALTSATGVGGGMMVSFLLRRFVLTAPTGKQGSPWMTALRVLGPQVLAYVAVALIAVGVGAMVLDQLAAGASGRWLAGIAVAVILASAFLFNPNELGLHPFYRSRIARAYLGASNFLAPHNRQVTPNAKDDVLLCDLDPKPLHLVCTAANDLGSDSLSTLNRGARSATLSQCGFSVGNRWWSWDEMPRKTSLASALTASGAAVNSNMGSYSKQLGGAVSFLLAALNIRLGYWLRTHAASLRSKWFPGVLFFREMFGDTYSNDETETFHLSDGGHFENLGLYELLRRRCRYILVSDCGADPDHQFEDLGNVLRRARADFGIEVEIDLAPLKLDENKMALQPVAVGDINYPGGDRGVILYIKPVLAGGEPDDILQYRLRNSAFPNETTGDQFYDEAQWESYRRLGLHTLRTVFRFAQDSSRQWTTEEVFGQARLDWYPVPPGLKENSLDRSKRLYELERQFEQIEHRGFLVGTYPELPWAGDPPADEPADAESIVSVIPMMNQMMQMLDDVYIACDLKQHWNHPLNIEWMNTFGRWFTTPIFRTWWPILSPMFSRGAMAFAEDRFGLPSASKLENVVRKGGKEGVATLLWRWMGNETEASKQRFAYDVRLDTGKRENEIRVEVGVAFVQLNGDTAQWSAEEFFIPPSFWGAGVGRKFLNHLLEHLPKENCVRARVEITEPAIRDESRRKELADLVQMYRQAGFKLEPRQPGDETGKMRMSRALAALPQSAFKKAS